MRTKLPWLLVLSFIGLLGCTPEQETPLAVATVAVTRPTLTTPTHTTTSTATATPTPIEFTPTPSVTTFAMASAAAAEKTATAAAQPTPTVTPTVPTPTPTATIPIVTPGGPVWPILFDGIPCPVPRSICDDNLFMDEPLQHHFLINSDGTGLKPLSETPNLSPTLLAPRMIRFSTDGTRLAYWGGNFHIFLANVDGSNPVDLGAAPEGFRGFDFLPEIGCLAFYRVPEAIAVETVILERACLHEPEPQLLGTLEFPELKPHFSIYRLSPQGDRLLAYGQNLQGGVSLYITQIRGNESPRLYSEQNSGGPIRWRPSGETIEFLVLGRPNTFFTVDTGQQIVLPRVSLDGFTVMTGDWSPDGSEFAFSYSTDNLQPARSGIYVLDFESGEWRQILAEFYVLNIFTWSPDIPEAWQP